MKRNLMMAAMAVSLVLAFASYANAANSELLKVNIPFEFQVGKASLPAGEYVVEIRRLSDTSALGTALAVRAADGTTHQIVTARAVPVKNGKAALTFNKYSNTYFLANVESFGIGCELNKSKAEKEIASKAGQFRTVSVAAE